MSDSGSEPRRSAPITQRPREPAARDGTAAPERKGDAAFALARALWGTKTAANRARARTLAEQAVAAFAEAGEGGADRRAAVEAWLAAHR